MNELLQAMLEPVNFFYTALLALVLLYWLSVIIGALDINSFDFDLDMDMDADIDIDADTELDTSVDGAANWMTGLLQFFHIGRIPLIIVLSFTALTMWVISIYAQQWMGPSWVLFFILFIPNLFAGLFVTKIVTLPLLPILENLDKGESAVNYIGRECKLLLSLSGEEIGQAEVILEDQTPLRIQVTLVNPGIGDLPKGSTALIIDKKTERDCYLIKPIADL